MRILHLDSGREMRGGQWQTLRLADGLAQDGHTIQFLAAGGSPCFEAARRMGIDAQPLTAGAVRRLSRQVDIVHAHDSRSHTLGALFSSAPVIVSRRVGFPIRGLLSRWKYAQPRCFIAVSNHVRQVLIDAGVGSGKISVVYDGVPLLPPSMPSQRVIAPASSDPQKGMALAAEAARLAGVNIHFSTDLENDLHDAGLFVYITQSEGLGSAALLAMSAGVPVIASNIGGLPEIVEHGKTGLLVNNTPQEIAAAILRIRQDYDFSKLFAARGRQSVEERFSIPVMISATEQVYESC